MSVSHSSAYLPLLMLIISLSHVVKSETSEQEVWDHIPPPAESLFKTDLSLGSDDEWQVRLGGHARTMVEAYRNPDFGFSGIHEDAWIHHRIQAFMALDHGRDLTLAAELSWGEMQGKKTALSPVDEDQPDFLQLYAETRWELDSSKLIMRVGRQILYYGSGRLLAHREGANQRLTHDAIRLGWHTKEWRLDGLFASPVKIKPESFDNTSYFGQTLLWGLYATGPSPFGPEHGVDLYYIGLQQENSPLSAGQSEHRHTFGTRWFGHTERWQYNHEFILQTGSSGNRDVLAGAISLGLGRLFPKAPLKPTLGFKADIISGGQNGKRVHTFHPLFQANNYFNEGGFVSPSNLWNLNPNLSLELRPTMSLNLGVNFLWRYDTGDDVYGPPFNSLAGAAPNGESYLGTAYNLALSWDPHPAFNVSLGYTHHEAGPSLTSIGGLSVDYLQLAMRLEF